MYQIIVVRARSTAYQISQKITFVSGSIKFLGRRLLAWSGMLPETKNLF